MRRLLLIIAALAAILAGGCSRSARTIREAVAGQLADFPDIPDSGQDLRQIDSLMAEGHLILHHSPVYEAAYHPHYRIIARGIFESDIKPLL